MTVHLLHLKQSPVLTQLQIEEALLRTDEDNWYILNEGSSPAIVMGISGRAEEVVDFQKREAAALPVIKRFSGGGTVVVDEGTLFATFICQKELHPFPPYPERILKWTEEFYKEVFSLPAFSLCENDYVLGGKKCGGNAQYIRKERCLHHTTFLFDYHLERMESLLYPKRVPAYRKGRSHTDFLCKLSWHFPSQAAIAQACIRELKRRFCVKPSSFEAVLKRIEGRSHRKATRPECI